MMNNCRKRARITIIIVCLVTVLAGCGGGIWLYRTIALPTHHGIELTGQPVENDYNNYLAGANVVRIEDKLYCSYAKNGYNYGIVEISEQGVQRIYWDGDKSWIAGYAPPSIREYDGKLLLQIEHSDTEEFPEGVMCYSPSSKSFEVFDEIHGISITDMDFQQHEDLFVCPVDVDTNHKSLYWQYKNTSGVIDEIFAYDYYVTDNTIVFHAKRGDGQPDGIWEYNVETQTEELLLRTDNKTIIYSIVTADADRVILSTNNGICEVQYISKNTMETLVKNHNAVCAYEDKLYVATKNAVGCYDLNTRTYQELAKQGADECYIVDDQWLYLAVYAKNVRRPQFLYRVKQDGTQLELVYG